MQFPAAASSMFLLLAVAVLAVGSASATVAPAELSIIDSARPTYPGNKPAVQSVTAAGFGVLDSGGIERSAPSTETTTMRGGSIVGLQTLTVTVDQSGKGNYARIQDAINAVPGSSGSSSGRVIIKIMPGTYRENVVVNKSGISLVGTSASSTIVTWSGKWTCDECATLCVLSTDFVASDITFQNTYGRGGQALAARVAGDRAAFYRCRFLSYQDTILDDKMGRHYYSDCYVEGATDFLFGPGKAFFERCHLHSISTEGGAFTAHGRNASSEDTGFSFVECNLTGIKAGGSILGRPWRPYARVVFARCNMSDTVDPVGWNNWDNPDNERTAFFGQFQCYGEGSRTEARVSWSHNHLSLAEAEPFLTKEAWVDGKDWIK